MHVPAAASHEPIAQFGGLVAGGVHCESVVHGVGAASAVGPVIASGPPSATAFPYAGNWLASITVLEHAPVVGSQVPFAPHDDVGPVGLLTASAVHDALNVMSSSAT